MRFGKLSALFGLLALTCSLIVGFSIMGDDGISGPLTRLLGTVISTDEVQYSLPEARSVSFFTLYESKLRLLLQGVVIIFACIAGVLAASAAKSDNNSFWYSLGVFTSVAALFEINILLAMVFAIVFVYLCLRNRRWKMSLS
ncbi:MAG: hypothetical protein AAF304_09960 [Pseudomonadota bacterium]